MFIQSTSSHHSPFIHSPFILHHSSSRHNLHHSPSQPSPSYPVTIHPASSTQSPFICLVTINQSTSTIHPVNLQKLSSHHSSIRLVTINQSTSTIHPVNLHQVFQSPFIIQPAPPSHHSSIHH